MINNVCTTSLQSQTDKADKWRYLRAPPPWHEKRQFHPWKLWALPSMILKKFLASIFSQQLVLSLMSIMFKKKKVKPEIRFKIKVTQHSVCFLQDSAKNTFNTFLWWWKSCRNSSVMSYSIFHIVQI